jgi:hypothetical protein
VLVTIADVVFQLSANEYGMYKSAAVIIPSV